jgi:hypothetical protein
MVSNFQGTQQDQESLAWHALYLADPSPRSLQKTKYDLD